MATKKVKKPAKLEKRVRFVHGDTLNEDVAGAVIEMIGKDWDNGIVLVALVDGRVLGITPDGVMVFASREAYQNHGQQVFKQMKQEQIN